MITSKANAVQQSHLKTGEKWNEVLKSGKQTTTG